MAAEKDDSTRAEQIKQQHEELCTDFLTYRVCPRGARCQRIHLYQNADVEQTATMLDYIIGHLHDQAIKLSVMQEQINQISESLKLDPRRSAERGRAKGGAERKRYSRQMRARSASSERASRVTTPMPSTSEGKQAGELQVTSQSFYPRQTIQHPVGMIYNPRPPIHHGSDIQFHSPYYYPGVIPFQVPTSSHTSTPPS
uniref:C3H1-type domain-containing protein n=1 Tax=Macrotermes natalensis lispivirus 1 TaxID=3133481 RepID=A0AAT9JF45_9MONO